VLSKTENPSFAESIFHLKRGFCGRFAPAKSAHSLPFREWRGLRATRCDLEEGRLRRPSSKQNGEDYFLGIPSRVDKFIPGLAWIEQWLRRTPTPL
jgi:hypothetical protein